MVVGSDPAGDDAQVAHLAHELVVGGLEHLGHERAVLGGQDFLLGGTFTLAPGAEPVHVGRAQPAGGDQVEQFLDSQVLARANAEHRHELARGDGVMGGFAQLVDRDRLAFEITHHHFFVGFDDLLDQHLIGFRRRQRAARRVLVVGLEHVDHAGKRGALANRHVERHALVAERFPDRFQVGPVVDVLGVHLGDRDEASQLEPPGLLEEPAGVHLDSRRTRDSQHHVFDGGEAHSERCR